MPKCNCTVTPHRHGVDRANFQRWYCPECGATWSDNPNPGRAGRPMEGDRPLTNAERSKRKREKQKQMSNLFNICKSIQCPFYQGQKRCARYSSEEHCHLIHPGDGEHRSNVFSATLGWIFAQVEDPRVDINALREENERSIAADPVAQQAVEWLQKEDLEYLKHLPYHLEQAGMTKELELFNNERNL